VFPHSTNLGLAYRYINNELSKAYSHEGLSIIHRRPANSKANYDLLKGSIFINLGSVFNNENNYDSSEYYFLKGNRNL